MLPFPVELRGNAPVYEQVVYAVQKAVLAGTLRPGDAFPSVRALSQELRINPNTAHKVVAHLTQEGLLEVRPGIGTVVASSADADPRAKQHFLERELEPWIVRARRLGITKSELIQHLQQQWKDLEPR